MTQFYFQENAAAGGSGSISSPWNQAAFDAALGSSGFRIGGADSLALLLGGTSILSISAASANRTPISGVGGATTVRLTNTIFENSVNIDLTQITGSNAIALQNSTGGTYFSISTGSTLNLNAAQATGLTITGFGTVNVSGLQSTLAANLSNISANVVTASAALSSNATFTGSLGKAAVSLSSASGTSTFTVNTATLRSAGGSIAVGSGVNLASTAGQVQQLTGATITTSGTGSVTLADLSGTGFADLSGITGNVIATIAASSATNAAGINLGTIRPTVNTGVTLTLTDSAANNFNIAQFNGAGSVVFVDASIASTVNLSVFTTGANTLTSGTATTKVISTGSGADSITTGAADDSITSGAGNDTISGAGGNNVIRSGSGADSVTALAGNDYIEGGGGNDTINAGDGNNFVTDSGNADSISTGTGDDTILSGADNDIISSGSGLDSIGAGSGADSITAAAGNDTVNGGGGNDTINAGAGNDSSSGGDGNDLFQVAANGDQVAADVIAGGTGTNTIGFIGAAAVTAEFDFDNISNVLTLNNADAGNLNVVRNVTFSAIAETTAQAVVVDLNNSTAAIDIINNAASSTTTFSITGGTSGDTLNGSNGADTLTGGSGADTINAGAGVDSVSGGNDNDQTLVAGTGQQVAGDIIHAGSGANTIAFTGAAGVIAEFDFDNISDVLTLNNAGDNLGQNRGVTFSAITETTAQTVVLDLSNSTTGVVNVTNNANSSTTAFALTGGAAADVLVGSNGADTITGGGGSDNLNGGTGVDRFVYTTNASIDTITGFVLGAAGDNLGVSQAGLVQVAYTGTGNANVNNIYTLIRQTAAGNAIFGVSQNIIVLEGATYANLAAAEAAIELGGNRALTNANAATSQATSTFQVVWTDTAGDSHFSQYTQVAAVAAAAAYQLNSGALTDLAVLTGVNASAANSFNAANIANLLA